MACRGGDDPERVARSFVDAYYVEYDFERALGFAEGAAKIRLDEEKKLVDDARSKVPVQDSRSRTYYDAPARRDVEPDLTHFTFDLEIKQGTSDIRRTAVVMIARRQGAWKVIAFREVGAREGAEPLHGARSSTGAASLNSVRSSTGGR